MMEGFVSDVEGGTHARAGWPGTCYGTSKLGVIALTRIHAQQLAPRGIAVNCCCPGYCATDMSSHGGPRSAAKGAETPAWLASAAPQGLTGRFFKDMVEAEW